MVRLILNLRPKWRWLVNFTPQPPYPQGWHPVPTYEGDQISDVRWVGHGWNKKCAQNFSCKTVGMVLVGRLSRKSEDCINVFSKISWSVVLCPVGTGGWLLWRRWWTFMFRQTRGFYDQLSIYKFLKKSPAPSSYLSLFLMLSLKEIFWKECERSTGTWRSSAARAVGALWRMLPSKVLFSATSVVPEWRASSRDSATSWCSDRQQAGIL
jgi:hypothetical protein